jgi:hypothetical protein
MDEFIQMAVDKLGVNEDTARKATGGLLSFLQKHADSGVMQELFSKIPGAKELVQQAPQQGGENKGGEGGGMLGRAMGAVSEKLGGTAGLMGVLKQSGLGTDKIGSFVNMFIQFVRDKAGSDVADKLLSSVPQLQKLG